MTTKKQWEDLLFRLWLCRQNKKLDRWTVARIDELADEVRRRRDSEVRA